MWVLDNLHILINWHNRYLHASHWLQCMDNSHILLNSTVFWAFCVNYPDSAVFSCYILSVAITNVKYWVSLCLLLSKEKCWNTLSPMELCPANVTAIAPSMAVASAIRANLVAFKSKPPASANSLNPLHCFRFQHIAMHSNSFTYSWNICWHRNGLTFIIMPSLKMGLGTQFYSERK